MAATDIIAELRAELDWGLEAIDADAAAKIKSAIQEIIKLREAIRQLASCAGTLSTCDGVVTVDCEPILTFEEKEAIKGAIAVARDSGAKNWIETLKQLLERNP
jgi:hypothetical protein